MKKSSLALLIIFTLVLIDQIVKIWIKTTMSIGESFPVFGDWFHIYFVENEGMAFGISFGAKIGKLLLTIVRIGVVSFLIFYLFKMIKKQKADLWLVAIFSLIIAGALGNIIDCVFYGWIWNYAPIFFGSVVDMFYFPLFMLPEWVPLWGGSYFFPAIFNVADSCVTIGIILIFIFHKKIFDKDSLST